MSNEFEDSGEGLQQDLQPAAPSDESAAVGAAAARVALPAPGAANALPAVDETPTAQPGGPAPANPASARCSCGAAVPEGQGHCQVCGRFTAFNVDALVTGLRSKKLQAKVDAYRVELIDELFEERGGKGALHVVQRIAIENYALVCAQFKTIEARLDQDGLFTQTGRRRSAFDMLKAISETIDRLRAELLPPITRPSQDAGIAAMPSSALHMASDLLKRQLAGEQLSDRELGQLDVLMAASHGKVLLPPDEPLMCDGPAPSRGGDHDA